jgi:hypothetical protein
MLISREYLAKFSRSPTQTVTIESKGAPSDIVGSLNRMLKMVGQLYIGEVEGRGSNVSTLMSNVFGDPTKTRTVLEARYLRAAGMLDKRGRRTQLGRASTLKNDEKSLKVGADRVKRQVVTSNAIRGKYQAMLNGRELNTQFKLGVEESPTSLFSLGFNLKVVGTEPDGESTVVQMAKVATDFVQSPATGRLHIESEGTQSIGGRSDKMVVLRTPDTNGVLTAIKNMAIHANFDHYNFRAQTRDDETGSLRAFLDDALSSMQLAKSNRGPLPGRATIVDKINATMNVTPDSLGSTKYPPGYNLVVTATIFSSGDVYYATDLRFVTVTDGNYVWAFSRMENRGDAYLTLGGVNFELGKFGNSLGKSEPWTGYFVSDPYPIVGKDLNVSEIKLNRPLATIDYSSPSYAAASGLEPIHLTDSEALDFESQLAGVLWNLYSASNGTDSASLEDYFTNRALTASADMRASDRDWKTFWVWRAIEVLHFGALVKLDSYNARILTPRGQKPMEASVKGRKYHVSQSITDMVFRACMATAWQLSTDYATQGFTAQRDIVHAKVSRSDFLVTTSTPLAVGLAKGVGTVIVTLPNPVIMALFRARTADDIVLSQKMQEVYLKSYATLTGPDVMDKKDRSRLLDGIVPVTRLIKTVGFDQTFSPASFAQSLIAVHHDLMTGASQSDRYRFLGIAARAYSGWFVSIASISSDQKKIEYDVFKSNKPNSSAWLAIYNYNSQRNVIMSGQLLEVAYLYST